MNNLKNTLLLNLPLDEIGINNQVRDVSGNNNHGTIAGTPQLFPDEIFGSCLSFDGDRDSLNLSQAVIPIGNEITISFWAHGVETLPTNSVLISALDPNQAVNLNINLSGSDSNIYFDCGNDGKSVDRISKNVRSVDFQGKWSHWAFTKNASKGEMKIYLNGVLWHSETGKNKTILTTTTVKVGCAPDGADKYQGKLTNLRIYSRALAVEEIQHDMESDRTALASFRQSYPIDFRLDDDNDQQVLYIDDDPAGYNLNLEIGNTSEQAIALIAPSNGSTASANNYHFALSFRPGTLSPAAEGKIAIAESGWSLSHERQTNGTVSLYLLSTSAQTVNPAGKILLTLQHVSTDGGGGARGTRVELKYQQLHYLGETTPISGSRIKHLGIINQLDKKNIPLHVGFVGSNTILNDGNSPNQLILRITNVLKDDPIPLHPTNSDSPSKLIISFEIDEDWALGTKSQVEAIVIEGKDWQHSGTPEADWQIRQETQGESPEWILTHQNATESRLASGQVVQLTISNIISSLPSGNTNLYVRYENIPGYWDGQFILTIEKAPILYRDSYVGIGTTTPSNPLSIRGVNRAEELLSFENSTGITKWHLNQNLGGNKPGLNFAETGVADGRLFLKVGGNIGIGTTNPQRPLHIKKYLGNQASTGIIRSAHTHGKTSQSWDFGVGDESIFGNNDYFGFQCVENQITSLVLDSSGNVGIGTTKPGAKLEVNGSIKSPMWRTLKIFDNSSGPLPISSGKFTTGGGTLLIFTSGSAYRSKPGTIGMDIRIDGNYQGSANVWTSESNSHKMFCNTLVVSGVPAGEHVAKIQKFSDAPETITDVNDSFNLTILELPF